MGHHRGGRTNFTAWAPDLRDASRALVRMPMLTAVVVLSLGVGIGVNTAVFTWIQAVVLRPLPGVPDPGGFSLIEPKAVTGSYPGASWPDYEDLRARLTAFPDLVAFRMAPVNVGEPGREERTFGLLVSANYFPALSLRPSAGRFFVAGEVSRAGGEAVVVISHDYWRRHFGGAPDIVGRRLRVNGASLAVIGVAPERFQGTVLGLDFDLWVPATLAPVLMPGSRELDDRSMRGYALLGRLAPDVTLARARVEVDAAFADAMRDHREAGGVTGAEILPFWQAPRGPQQLLAKALAVLQLLLLLLLLAVCGNTASLVLARASARRDEMTMRLALGSGRLGIARLCLTESLLLALGGVLVGLVIAIWASQALRAVPLIGAFPIRFQTGVDLTSFAFATCLGLLSGVVFGAPAAAMLSRLEPDQTLRGGGTTPGHAGLRHALMAGEVAVALVVLVAAALLLRGYVDTRETDPGFRREGVLLAAYDLSGRGRDDAGALEFASRLVRALGEVPGVTSTALASSVPLDIHGLSTREFAVEGRESGDGQPSRALTNTVTPAYFATMGIPFVEGTDFASLDDRVAPPQAVVNQTFVRRFLSDVEPLGRRLVVRGRSFAIVGVVRDSLSESFGEPPTPVVYFSYRDRPLGRGEIHVWTRPGAETLLSPAIERVVRGLDPSLPVYDVRTLDEHVEKNLFLRRIPARMFVVLGPLLLILAATGVYAVSAYAVSRRTREIGLRVALGATPRRVVGEVVGRAWRAVAAGAMAGWVVALTVALHLVRGPLSVSVFVGVPVLLVGAATVACWLPAHRAAGLSPMVALGEGGGRMRDRRRVRGVRGAGPVGGGPYGGQVLP
ncbi:MAG: ADOP family duplicated permease [Vicinamibacterales bacterium]